MSSTQTTAPRAITGTWITFFHQDSRNDYTNPRAAAEKDWAGVVEDLADIGMEKLIVMAVANDGQAVYPSRVRAPVLTPDGSTPLDILMRVAADRGLGVYLSAGWTRDQMDDLGDPAVVAGQRAILEELADLYQDHAAFEGWYLPCEDAVAPRFSDRTIEGVNALASVARARTPDARVLISPYFPHAAIVDEAFVAALATIDVDIIAYQDGVGCGFTTSIAAQWERLRWAHDRVERIELWANVESFTWERGIANTLHDALVPAAFPRLHRQILDASPFVDRTVSFIAQGLLQSPATLGSERGHDPSSRTDYLDHAADAGRWPLLENLDALAGTSIALGIAVACDPRPVPAFVAEHRLTAGRPARTLDPMDPVWVRLRGDAVLTLDLGSEQPIRDVVVSFLHAPILHVGQPSEILIEGSTDALAWHPLGRWSAPHWPFDALDRWRDLAIVTVDNETAATARHLRLTLAASGGEMLLDQVIVRSEGSATRE